jgi:hypothetical protein
LPTISGIDYERQPQVAEGLIRWAAIAGLARRTTRGHHAATATPPHLHLALTQSQTLILGGADRNLAHQ